MKAKRNEKGFSYIETIIAMVVVTVGLLSALSALTWGFVYMQEAEKKTRAKQIANSSIESVFAVRDMTNVGGIALGGWTVIQNQATNPGIFVDGWYPARVDPGSDGIYGTTDDSCPIGDSCNSNPEIEGYYRKIEITDIVDSREVRKRHLDVTVKYYVNSLERQEKMSTIIANLPFN